MLIKSDFLEKQLNLIKDIQNGDSTWANLADMRAECLGEQLSVDSLRRSKLLLYDYLEAGWIQKPTLPSLITNKKSISVNGDGSQCSEGKFEVDDESKLKDADYLLRLHGYDSCQWELVNSKNSFWEAQTKSNGVKTMYSSKVTVKPRSDEWSIADIDAYFENKVFNIEREIYALTNYDPNGEVLEITLPDMHVGLLSSSEETKESYDIKIVKKRFNKCLCDIIERIGDRKFSKIYLVPLGDLLHVDNANYSTNKATIQDCDGRFTKMLDNTLDMLIDGIEMLVKSVNTKIHIPYISGNHSRVLEYSLFKALEAAFRKDDNVIIDTLPSPSKYEQFGNILLGWTHGDAPQQNICEWLQSHAREEFGRSKFVEVHTGHRHTTMTIEKSGMIIRYLPTICSSSPWENQQLYNKGVKTVVSFVWNPKNGLREMWFSNI